MKKLFSILALVFVLSPITPPTISQAQVTEQWQCNLQTYCSPYGCWQRQQCCRTLYNWQTGQYFWECVWR